MLHVITYVVPVTTPEISPTSQGCDTDFAHGLDPVH